MGAVTDAEAIMDLVDASVLVVRQNAAAAPVINKVLASLNSAKSRMLGCVLNNVYSTDFFSGQGYGYGSYGKYGRYGKYGSYGRYGAYNRYAKNSNHQNS
jgi:Mrp family chromosome partitioning ATPase